MLTTPEKKYRIISDSNALDVIDHLYITGQVRPTPLRALDRVYCPRTVTTRRLKITPKSTNSTFLSPISINITIGS